MQLIKTLLVAALAVTTTIAAALPDYTTPNSQQTSVIVLDDPGIWNHKVCNALCLIKENECIRNTGRSKLNCSADTCEANQVYVSLASMKKDVLK
jgi:hypothetical protein